MRRRIPPRKKAKSTRPRKRDKVLDCLPDDIDLTPATPTAPSKPLPKSWPYREMTRELCDFLKKHKPKTWGEALGLIHTMQSEERFEEVEKAGGKLGYSGFMTDLLWHISSMDGPLGKINYA